MSRVGRRPRADDMDIDVKSPGSAPFGRHGAEFSADDDSGSEGDFYSDEGGSGSEDQSASLSGEDLLQLFRDDGHRDHDLTFGMTRKILSYVYGSYIHHGTTGDFSSTVERARHLLRADDLPFGGELTTLHTEYLSLSALMMRMQFVVMDSGNGRDEALVDVIDSISVFMVQSWALLVADINLVTLMMPPEERKAIPALPPPEHITRFMPSVRRMAVPLDAKTSYILWVLDRLAHHKYRRMEDCCYKEVITPEGFRTNAWVLECTIEEFLYRETTKERWFEQWKVLTSIDPKRSVCYLLSHGSDMEFPSLEPDRHAFACRDMMFRLPKDDSQPLGIEFVPYSQGRPETVSCRYFDIPCTPVDDVKNWRDIPTPGWESIMDVQKLPEEARKWMYVLVGRMLYDVGTLDDWQCAPFIKGIAKSGKSTICKVIQNIYHMKHVGQLNNNMERKFGLAGIYNKLLATAPEVREDFALNQSDYQSMTSGEAMTVARKGELAVHMEAWKTPLFMAGNMLPRWKDTGGSLSRRMVVFLFTQSPTTNDPRLARKMIQNIVGLIVKSACAYLEVLEETRDCGGLWEIIPDYFTETKHTLQTQFSAFKKFFDKTYARTASESDQILRDDMRREFSNWVNSQEFNRKEFTDNEVSEMMNTTFAESGVPQITHLETQQVWCTHLVKLS